jgi:hypothetical protein
VLTGGVPTVFGELAALGPFFVLEGHSRDAVPSPPWHPMSELVDGSGALAARVGEVRARLAAAGGQPVEAVESRVAASVTHLGLVARLVSPALAVAVLHGRLLELDLPALRWQRELGGAFPLSVPTGAIDESDASAGVLADRVVAGPVRELVEATVPFSVSPHVLWGNVASAVHGAASMIAGARPDLADRAHALASAVLDLPPLRDTSTPARDGVPFRRRSCCLIYRVAPGAAGPVCGDCVLAGRR